MYLSRLILNASDRAVRRDIADCQRLHRTVMSGFPNRARHGEARGEFGVLYRLDASPRVGDITLLVQARQQPDWDSLPPGYLLALPGGPRNPACKLVADYYAQITAGQRLRFRLRANPTRRIDTKSGPDGRRRNGRRVEVRGEAGLLDWLRRKGDEAGFELLQSRAAEGALAVQAIEEPKRAGARRGDESDEVRGGGRLTFASVLFDGELRVRDAQRFRWALEQGIGPGKAYGFGLLSIGPFPAG